jgi:hypothetical protein
VFVDVLRSGCTPGDCAGDGGSVVLRISMGQIEIIYDLWVDILYWG